MLSTSLHFCHLAEFNFCCMLRLTLYNAIPTFNAPEKKSFLKTLWEKQKMLVTSIFCFSHNVFYPSQKEFLFWSYIYLVICKYFQLDQSENLSFGKELSLCHIIQTFKNPETDLFENIMGDKRAMMALESLSWVFQIVGLLYWGLTPL